MSVCLQVTTQELLHRFQFCFTLHEEIHGFLCTFWVLTHYIITRVENVSHTEVVEKMEHKSSRENRTCLAQKILCSVLWFQK